MEALQLCMEHGKGHVEIGEPALDFHGLSTYPWILTHEGPDLAFCFQSGNFHVHQSNRPIALNFFTANLNASACFADFRRDVAVRQLLRKATAEADERMQSHRRSGRRD